MLEQIDSRIEASELFPNDFPLSFLFLATWASGMLINFTWRRICEIILLTFFGVEDKSKNLKRCAM